MVDHSFHQHGPQLLAGAYGAVFTSDILDLAFISASTSFQVHIPTFDRVLFPTFLTITMVQMDRCHPPLYMCSKAWCWTVSHG